MSADDVKAHSNARFSQFAQNYVTSDTHAQGHDLDRLLEVARNLNNGEPFGLAMDIATGGGHTALKFAPVSSKMIALDYSTSMLNAARQFIAGQGVNNMAYVNSDAENIAFADNTFDLITCRVAPHHFPNVFRFMQEVTRVLKPGGMFILLDHLLPGDAKAAAYIEAFERLRDPSHHQAFNQDEWRGLLLDAGMEVLHEERLNRQAKMLPWAERQNCSPEVIERLHVLMVQAPQPVAEWMNIQCAGTADAMFDHTYLLIAGRKPRG
jgi:ubiquinone/menaquinone biosynthesis C-methylase UbiE